MSYDLPRDESVTECFSWCRDGTEELCLVLHQAGVPVLVLSAGMGDVLEEVLRHFNVYTDNVKVVSNFFEYNEEVRNHICVCVYILIGKHETCFESKCSIKDLQLVVTFSCNEWAWNIFTMH